jgi:hypothetical protein
LLLGGVQNAFEIVLGHGARCVKADVASRIGGDELAVESFLECHSEQVEHVLACLVFAFAAINPVEDIPAPDGRQQCAAEFVGGDVVLPAMRSVRIPRTRERSRRSKKPCPN